MDKVILAYSGGLDTTAVIPWLKETYQYSEYYGLSDVCGKYTSGQYPSVGET